MIRFFANLMTLVAAISASAGAVIFVMMFSEKNITSAMYFRDAIFLVTGFLPVYLLKFKNGLYSIGIATMHFALIYAMNVRLI